MRHALLALAALLLLAPDARALGPRVRLRPRPIDRQLLRPVLLVGAPLPHVELSPRVASPLGSWTLAPGVMDVLVVPIAVHDLVVVPSQPLLGWSLAPLCLEPTPPPTPEELARRFGWVAASDRAAEREREARVAALEAAIARLRASHPARARRPRRPPCARS